MVHLKKQKHHLFQFILKKWHEQLYNRSKEEKVSVNGKLVGATYTQTQEYLKPLLRKLKTFTLPEDISDSLTEIVVHLLNRNYLKVRTKIHAKNPKLHIYCLRRVMRIFKWQLATLLGLSALLWLVSTLVRVVRRFSPRT